MRHLEPADLDWQGTSRSRCCFSSAQRGILSTVRQVRHRHLIKVEIEIVTLPNEPTAITATAPRKIYRTDIDGLRGLAIALVVIFHCFVGRVSSGVDVFLFIGGYFFFSSQLKNALSAQGTSFVSAVVRIMRRLFPALLAVILATMLLALALFSKARWQHVGEDAIASLLYVQNLNLASDGQDYAAIGRDVSIYQHIWSMSAQLQIYLASLIVIAAFGWLWRSAINGKNSTAQAIMAIILAAATLSSFAYAGYLHQINQGLNYYSPLSRFWEIGLGGLFGMLLGLKKVRTVAQGSARWWQLPTGIVGIAAILFTGLFLNGSQEFPGPLTLIPLAGAALVIVAGTNPTRWSVTTVLDMPVFQFLGRISYSLYLWHWPLLVIATRYFSSGPGNGDAHGMGITRTLGIQKGIVVGVSVIALSMLLAWCTLRWVESPLRGKAKAPRTAAFVFPSRSMLAQLGGTVIVTVLTLTLAQQIQELRPSASAQKFTGEPNVVFPGPYALLTNTDAPEVPPVPDAANTAESMYPPTDRDQCSSLYDGSELVLTHGRNTKTEECAFGDATASRTMYLYGSSHAEHHLPALDIIGRRQGIKVIPLVKMGCYPGLNLPRKDGQPYPECAEWQEKAMQHMIDNPPTDGVFMINTLPHLGFMNNGIVPDDKAEVVPPQFESVTKRLSDHGIHIWGLRDTPYLRDEKGQLDVRLCVSDGFYQPGSTKNDCGMSRSDALAETNPAIDAYQGIDITNLDLTSGLCNHQRCPGVIGNMLVYRDSSHITNVYSEALAGELERQMFGTELPELGGQW